MASSGTLLLVQEFLSHGTRACIYDPLGSGLSALAGRIVVFFGGLPGWIRDGSLGGFQGWCFFFEGQWGHLDTFRRFDLYAHGVIFDKSPGLNVPYHFFQRTWKMEVANPPGWRSASENFLDVWSSSPLRVFSGKGANRRAPFSRHCTLSLYIYIYRIEAAGNTWYIHFSN